MEPRRPQWSLLRPGRVCQSVCVRVCMCAYVSLPCIYMKYVYYLKVSLHILDICICVCTFWFSSCVCVSGFQVWFVIDCGLSGHMLVYEKNCVRCLILIILTLELTILVNHHGHLLTLLLWLAGLIPKFGINCKISAWTDRHKPPQMKTCRNGYVHTYKWIYYIIYSSS